MVTYYTIECGDCNVKYNAEDDETECELCGSTNITKTTHEV